MFENCGTTLSSDFFLFYSIVYFWIPFIHAELFSISSTICLMLSIFFQVLIFLYIYWRETHDCHIILVKGTGQPVGVDSLLLLCRSWELNSNHQVWQQVRLLTEPSPTPSQPFVFAYVPLGLIR